MTRVRYLLAYLALMTQELLKYSWVVSRTAFTGRPALRPAIVEIPLRCRTDLEVTALTSSITIPPATIVLGIAAADENGPTRIYVHAMYTDRDETIREVRRLEAAILSVTQGRIAREEEP